MYLASKKKKKEKEKQRKSPNIILFLNDNNNDDDYAVNDNDDDHDNDKDSGLLTANLSRISQIIFTQIYAGLINTQLMDYQTGQTIITVV